MGDITAAIATYDFAHSAVLVVSKSHIKKLPALLDETFSVAASSHCLSACICVQTLHNEINVFSVRCSYMQIKCLCI